MSAPAEGLFAIFNRQPVLQRIEAFDRAERALLHELTQQCEIAAVRAEMLHGADGAAWTALAAQVEETVTGPLGALLAGKAEPKGEIVPALRAAKDALEELQYVASIGDTLDPDDPDDQAMCTGRLQEAASDLLFALRRA